MKPSLLIFPWLRHFGCLLFILGAILSSSPAVAQTGLTYDQAMAQCQANSPGWANQFNDGIWDHSTANCHNVPGQQMVGWSMNTTPSGAAAGYQNLVNHYTISYVGSGPPNATNDCTGLPSETMYMNSSSPILSSYHFSLPQTDKNNGSTVQCDYVFNPIGVSTYVPDLQQYETNGTWSPTGNLATDQGSGNGVTDGKGNQVSTSPTPDPIAPPAQQPPPQVCGGGSCYDPTTDQYCATVGGQQMCVAGSDGRTLTGNCSSGSGGAVCSGAPTSPSPSANVIPDPATQIRSVDQVQQVDPSSGLPVVVTTSVYATGATQTSSGQKTGDNGPSNGGGSTTGNQPAHASSAGGNGTYSGGTDCNTPPVCTGDAVLCGASRTQWATTCGVHRDLAGTDPAPSSSTLGNGGAYDQGSLWVKPSTGTTVGDQANQGNYDQSGFGYGTQCPFTDTSITLLGSSFSVPWSEACTVTSYLRWIIIGFATFAAARITAGGSH